MRSGVTRSRNGYADAGDSAAAGGMGQLAKITYTYYTLRKTIYSIATYLSVSRA